MDDKKIIKAIEKAYQDYNSGNINDPANKVKKYSAKFTGSHKSYDYELTWLNRTSTTKI